MKNKIIIIFFIILVMSVFVFINPVSQPQNYYNFSDKNNYFGISNFWNVISNIPFLIVGFYGLVLNKQKS